MNPLPMSSEDRDEHIKVIKHVVMFIYTTFKIITIK